MSEADAAAGQTQSTGGAAAPAEPAPAAAPAATAAPATAGNQPATAQAAPEKYDFKLPEGQSVDPAVMKEWEAFSRSLGLPQDKAQEGLSKFSSLFASQRDAQAAQWAEASRADKEFGGEKFDANLAIAKRALDELGTPELRALLNTTKFGDHPEIIRWAFRAGQKLTPDSVVPGGKPQPESSGLSIANKLYPNHP